MIKGYSNTITNHDSLLVSTDSFIGKTIQSVENCAFNHSGKFIWLYGELYVCEAANRGIALTPFSKYTSNTDKYKLLIQKPKTALTNEQIQTMFKFALERCGHVRYEYLNLLVYQPIKFLTGIWLGAKTPNQADRAYICGEWVARLYNVSNGWFENQWEKLAPVDLYNSDLFENYIYTE